jgi:hypothetical protein
MGITTVGFDLTSENLLIIANIILIIIAVFILMRLRIANKKNKPEKEKKTELSGIADIKPEDFKMDRLDLNKEILQQEKSDIKPFDAGLESEIQPLAISVTNDVKPGTIEDTDELVENPEAMPINGQSVTPEINQLKLEDDSLEETIVIQSEDITSGVETHDNVTTAATEQIDTAEPIILTQENSRISQSESLPAALEVEPSVMNPGNTEKPKMKTTKKKKPGRKKKVSASAGTQSPVKEKKPKQKAKREPLF